MVSLAATSYKTLSDVFDSRLDGKHQDAVTTILDCLIGVPVKYTWNRISWGAFDPKQF